MTDLNSIPPPSHAARPSRSLSRRPFLPFGAFAETADGTVGLVRDLRNGAVGDLVEIRVDGVDDVKHRFSGMSTN